MKKLTLTLPGLDPTGFQRIDLPDLKFSGPKADLGSVLTDLFSLIITFAFFLAFFWLVWGAFQYMSAGGNKEGIAKARARITWAIVGLILTVAAFLVAQFAEQIIQPKGGSPLSLIPPVYAAVDIGKEYGFGDILTLGEGVNRLVRPTFSIAMAVVVIYFLAGAYKYLTSAGDKETVSGARSMITHSIIGFMILIFAFLVLQFGLSSLFGIEGLQIFDTGKGIP